MSPGATADTATATTLDSVKGGVPLFAAMPLDDIQDRYDTLRKTYRTNRTKDFEYRKKQIRRLYWGLVDCAPLIAEALMKDMGKCRYEAELTELEWCKTECVNVANKLEAWARDEPVADLPWQYWPMKMRVRSEPLGTILMIGAYNYPFQLNITPVIGAIAAGNTVVLKPSEHSPHSAMVLKKLFDDYLDPECYVCINGALDETKYLMDLKFDKVVFTGGRKTGAIIATKAAQSLTPVVLELGGQNPAFITKNTDVKLAARRLLWQKSLNAGQLCLSHNYVLIDRTLVSKFIGEVQRAYRTFMPDGAKNSPDYARIVNKMHFSRIKAMVDNTKGKIVMGGVFDESDLFIEPTVVLVNSIDDTMMIEESFGPVWSIMPVDSLDQAIDVANKVDPTPLALYTFGSDAENKKILENVTSGGATINDGFFHCMVNSSPIGGVGASGMGSYHGYYSFKAFSHQRCIAKVPNWADRLLRMRYMPYKWTELDRYKKLSAPKVNFDRDGNVVQGLKHWAGLVFGLGGQSTSSAVLRWGILVTALVFFGLNQRHYLKHWHLNS